MAGLSASMPPMNPLPSIVIRSDPGRCACYETDISRAPYARVEPPLRARSIEPSALQSPEPQRHEGEDAQDDGRPDEVLGQCRVLRIAKEAVTPTRIRNGAVRPSGTYLTRPTLAALKKLASKIASSNANR